MMCIITLGDIIPLFSARGTNFAERKQRNSCNKWVQREVRAQ